MNQARKHFQPVVTQKLHSAGSYSKMARDWMFVTFLLKPETKKRTDIHALRRGDCLVWMTYMVSERGGHGVLSFSPQKWTLLVLSKFEGIKSVFEPTGWIWWNFTTIDTGLAFPHSSRDYGTAEPLCSPHHLSFPLAYLKDYTSITR